MPKIAKCGFVLNGVRFRPIKLKNLVNFRSNRKLNKGRVKRLARDWNWLMAGVPMVQMVPDGKGQAMLLDWHHRCSALHLAINGTTDEEGKEIEVLCIVVPNNVDACDFHCDVNDPSKVKGNSRRELFYSRYSENKQPERFIFNRMQDAGIECVFEGSFSDGNSSFGKCYCPHVLLDIYNEFGRNNFRSLIDCMLSVWGEPDNEVIESTAVRSDFLQGLMKYILWSQKSVDDVIYLLKSAKNIYESFRSEDIYYWAKQEYMDGSGYGRIDGICAEFCDLLDSLDDNHLSIAA